MAYSTSCWILIVICSFTLLKGNTSDKIPVIIDTDVGSFIDDSFAIAFAALNKHLDVKLVVTCTNDTTSRAKVAAKLLHLVGRDDVPIGLGVKNENETLQTLYAWAEHVDLAEYPGKVYDDGVAQMAEVIASSPSPVSIVSIGPMINFPTLIQRFPEAVRNSRIFAMAGSIRNSTEYDYNIHVCPYCFKTVLKAGWNVTITPIDTCGSARLDVAELKEVLQIDGLQSLGLASSLAYFCLNKVYPCDLSALGTPVLYDTVAVLMTLPFSEQYLVFKELRLEVDSEGRTLQNQTAGEWVDVALDWKDERDFTLYLAAVLSKLQRE